MNNENNPIPAPIQQPVGRCGIIAPRRPGFPVDLFGCVCSDYHNSPHIFEEGGKFYEWYTDHACNCKSCQSEEAADWCIVWSECDPPNSELCRKPAEDGVDGKPSNAGGTP